VAWTKKKKVGIRSDVKRIFFEFEESRYIPIPRFLAVIILHGVLYASGPYFRLEF
jgi:hypothetical protein